MVIGESESTSKSPACTQWLRIASLVANFAAYAFAPPILVTPLGALSVIIGYVSLPNPGRVLNVVHRSAILASVFLKEELGHLGRIGCTLCLIGSLIIILHAPDTKDVKTVDEILQYAIQPGMKALVQTQVVALSEREPPLLTAAHRFSPVLLHRPCVLARHDLLRFSSLWKNDTHRVHLDMLPSWVRFRHGY